MKLKTIILVFVILFNLCETYAQLNTMPSFVDTIQYFKGRERYFLDNQRLTFAEMKLMLNTFNSSRIQFKEYRKRATPGTLALLTGLTAGILAFTKLNKETHFFTPYTITLFAGDIIGIPLMISANKHLKKSVMLYNKEFFK